MARISWILGVSVAAMALVATGCARTIPLNQPQRVAGIALARSVDLTGLTPAQLQMRLDAAMRAAFQEEGLEGGPEVETPDPPLMRTEHNPLILVPGYLDASWYFGLIRRRAIAEGRSPVTLKLFPNIGDVRKTAEKLKASVEAIRRRTGAAQVDIVGHSEGGLIARHYIRFLNGESQVARLVTLATPHHGTNVAYLGPGMGADQMQPGSSFLQLLNEGDESWGGVRYTSIRGSLDEIILPHSSMIQAGASNHEVNFIEHATILTSKRVWAIASDALQK